MRTRSQSRNSNRQQQQVNPTFVEPFNLVEPIENQAPPVVTMDDTRTMAQLLEAPTVGYEDAIVVPEITANNFELKHESSRANPSSLSTYKPVVAKVSASSSTPSISPDVAKLKDMVKALLLDKKSQAPAPVKGSRKVVLLVVERILTKIVLLPMATFIVTIFKNLFPKQQQLISIKEIQVTEPRLLIKFDLPVFLPFKTKETIKTVTTKTGGLITTKAKFIDLRLINPRFTKLHLTKLRLRKHKV
ncbi:hypothetical protein Tco_0752425 [Tanacetum coccineum]|uniref:Reverse transcriptase domain-containing protein n=1 Tax=Tanacetum coccineum TaxID=301880 RepID=A0ABQ4Z6T1_9ASTR